MVIISVSCRWIGKIHPNDFVKQHSSNNLKTFSTQKKIYNKTLYTVKSSNLVKQNTTLMIFSGLQSSTQNVENDFLKS